MQCCLTIFLNKIVLYHYKNMMQIYQFVKAPYHLASSKYNFHLRCHGHIPYIKCMFKPWRRCRKFRFTEAKKIGQGQMYTALSRVSSFDKLFCVGKFEPSSIKMNVSALQEYERLRQNSILQNIEKIIVTDDSIKILLLKVRSLKTCMWH